MSRRLPPRILALTPGTLRAEDLPRLLAAVDSALAAGLRGVLLREPGLEDAALLELARRLRERLDPDAGGWLGVHDRAHVAELVGADGLHLGFRSLPPDRLPNGQPANRRLPQWGPRAVGLSAHASDAMEAWSGADYLFFGPVRSTPSKAGLVEPTGLEGLREAIDRASVPVLAIGGLEPGDVAPCLRAGAAGVAVLRGILGATGPGSVGSGSADPGAAAAAYLAAAAEVPA